MSRNSKNAQRIAAKKQGRRAQNGTHGATSTGHVGAKKTTPVHGKRNAWWQQFMTYRDYIKGGKDAKKRKQQQEQATEVAEEPVTA